MLCTHDHQSSRWAFNSSGIFAQYIPSESTSDQEHPHHPHTIRVIEGQAEGTQSGGISRGCECRSPRCRRPESKDAGLARPVKDQRATVFSSSTSSNTVRKLGGRKYNDYRWDIEGWYGGDYNRLWFKSEGQQDTAFKADYDIDSQLLFGRFIQKYYDFQVGGRLSKHNPFGDGT